ncbi:glycine--tRNA ligase subunit beta [Colwellia sp. MB02u-10]|uniref:glycine--tRNA ligase subunit beta n=1 Tax=Colwellia sp. MB02u-10 TaxID=2759828 RepID=UPI0015F60E8B|nr:glycine--tRNA ligase subunit beta [Colwellia sp. MB02u-10]MBA6342802.1 glycine--tRNA ligase subunit beta [Colwellia sp. MB02u-10]
MTTETLLIELGTEELPPKSLRTLATTFFEQIKLQLDEAKLSYSDIYWYATPRRLAVKVDNLVANQADKAIEKRGPAVSVAFDAAGKPSKAAEGWARSNGITVAQAERLVTDKGEWLLYKTIEQGKHVEQLIPDMVNLAIAKLPVPKPMRWGSGRTQFIRPVHTLTLLYGASVIAGESLNICSNNLVTGHRFHHHGLVALAHADDYESALKAAHVVVDYQARKDTIQQQINAAAIAIGGFVLPDDELLEEVTSLVEWPVVLTGSFDKEFLNVPAEPLIYSMKDHQKYFPVTDSEGNLLNKFIFVSNIDSKDPSQVIKGNEKVIRPRLADAEFFFKTDKKQSLESRLQGLESMLFQKQLGTVKAKSERIASLSEFVADKTGDDTAIAYRAGLLSKTDLMSDMVLEFPQVQGTMGKYYAQHDGEPAAVAQALEDQYRPRFAGDVLPEQTIGCAVAIADKVDTLVGIFGINQAPKGDKDPFALRRAAIGLIRIIIEKDLNLDIADLVAKSVELYQDKLSNQDVTQQVLEFVFGRYRAYYQDQNITVDVIQAVLANAPSSPLDFDKRIHAVTHFKTLGEAATLAAANKRVGNILVKFKGELFNTFKADLATEAAEAELASAFSVVNTKIAPLMATKDYQSALTELAALKQPIDNFFDHVMVMADDEQVKTNRLTLLNEIRNSFLAIADISLLQ